MRRWSALLFGAATYVMFLGVFVYAVGFVGGIFVSKGLDSPVSTPFTEAIGVNALLLLLFAVQHSTMARPWFKRWWSRLIPTPIERSTYVLFTNLALGLLFWQWRPMSGTVWNVQQPSVRSAIWFVFAFGWLTVLVTTFLLNHFDLFGLRQVWLYFRGRPYSHLPFATPGPYRIVRHPLYVGWLLAFWATPTMSVAHFVFALTMTAYILVAIQFEERDLIRFHMVYAEYRRRVPMLIPRLAGINQQDVATVSMPTESSPTSKVVARLKLN